MIYTIDENEYEISGPHGIGTCECSRKFPVEPAKRNNRNRFSFKVRLNHYESAAEVLSSGIGKMTIGNFCDCEFAKRPTGVINNFSYGSSSFHYYSTSDKLISTSEMILDFLKEQQLPTDCVRRGRVDIDTCLHSILRLLNLQHRPFQEYEHIKQQFIDMVMFDCRFGNDDRGINNWMIYQNTQTGVFELYPLFDHEIFLGIGDNLTCFALRDEIADGANIGKEKLVPNRELIIDYNSRLKIKTLAPKDLEQGYSSYEDVLNFLISKYPVETTKACQKINSCNFVTLEQFLNEVLDEFKSTSVSDGYEEFYKKVAKANFINRTLVFNKIVNSCQRDNKVHFKE